MSSGLLLWLGILIVGEVIFITLAVTIYLLLKKKKPAAKPQVAASASCVAVLEEENQFFRDQIASLLKLSDASVQ